MIPKIGIQLYAVRDQLADDFDGTVERLAEIGFEGVETAVYEPDSQLAQRARKLRGLGLEICAAHTALPLGSDREDVLQQVADLEVPRIIYHGGYEEDRFASRAGIEQLALEIEAAQRVAEDLGVSLGLHTHWWEQAEIDGRPGYEWLRNMTNDSLFFEVDVYWAKVGGAEPSAMIQELGERVTFLHVQDGPGTGIQDAQLALGKGVVDLPASIHAADHAEWLVLEFDTFEGDRMAAIAESYDYLRSVTGGAS